MNIITMLPWCPLMLEVLGVVTQRRYFTILHTKSGVQFFDGIESGDLTYPGALVEFKNHQKNKIILNPFDWEGDNLQKLPHILLFDQLLERIVVRDYKKTVQLLTFSNEDVARRVYNHDIISNETQAVNILNNWLLNNKESISNVRVC